MVLESVVCLAWKAMFMSLYRGESIEGYENANGGFDFCQSLLLSKWSNLFRGKQIKTSYDWENENSDGMHHVFTFKLWSLFPFSNWKMLLSPLMYLGDESRESLHPKYQEWFVSTTQLLKSLVMETGFSSPSSNTLRLELECSSTNIVAMSVEQAGIKQTKAIYFLLFIRVRT